MGRWFSRGSLAKVRRLALIGVVCATIAALSLVGLSTAIITHRSTGLITADPAAVPAREVVIVPGSFVFEDGTPSQIVADRLDGARLLYEDGRVQHVLVSGDNSRDRYNEPAVMRNLLVDAGLPASDITVDYAGLDTWDTCQRAAEQFGVTEAVVVTQRLYAVRTAALCRSAGIDVTVLAIDPPPQRPITKLRVGSREALANVKAWRDVLTDPPARYGGPFIGLVGSVGMPEGGHPPDWDWDANAPQASGD